MLKLKLCDDDVNDDYVDVDNDIDCEDDANDYYDDDDYCFRSCLVHLNIFRIA